MLLLLLLVFLLLLLLLLLLLPGLLLLLPSVFAFLPLLLPGCTSVGGGWAVGRERKAGSHGGKMSAMDFGRPSERNEEA